jgi:hypothetical protein
MGDLVLKGATSGQITLTPVGTAGTNTLTLPARTGNIITSADTGTVTQTMLSTNVVGNGPAFGVYGNTSQTGLTSGAYQKINFNTVEFNNNSNFDATTNYRFTATVAGLYQFNVCVYVGPGTSNTLTQIQPFIYKNGVAFKIGNWINNQGASNYPVAGYIATASAIISLSVTDYIEFYAYAAVTSGTWGILADQRYTYASGALIRSA